MCVCVCVCVLTRIVEIIVWGFWLLFSSNHRHFLFPLLRWHWNTSHTQEVWIHNCEARLRVRRFSEHNLSPVVFLRGFCMCEFADDGLDPESPAAHICLGSTQESKEQQHHTKRCVIFVLHGFTCTRTYIWETHIAAKKWAAYLMILSYDLMRIFKFDPIHNLNFELITHLSWSNQIKTISYYIKSQIKSTYFLW